MFIKFFREYFFFFERQYQLRLNHPPRRRALPTTCPNYVVLTGPTLAQVRINGFARKPYRLHTRFPCWSNGQIKTPLMLRFEPQRLGLRALLFIASYLRNNMIHKWTTSEDFPGGHPPGTTPTYGSLNKLSPTH